MIKIVMGPACGGKSTYIKNYLQDFVKIDLFDFQEHAFTYEQILKSYEACRDALKKAITENENVVLEHTLLKACRREMYIDAIKEITNEDIEIIVIKPNRELLKERSSLRGLKYSDEDIDNIFEILEIPTIEEGFSKVTIIEE